MAYDLFDELFGEFVTKAEFLVWSTWIAHLYDEDKLARAEAQVLVDWYQRDRVAIIERLKAAAAKTFGDETEDWQFPLSNGVPRIIGRVSMMYKSPPVRTYKRGDKELEEGDPNLEKIAAMYGPLDRDRKMKEADNWTTLLNTVHMESVLRKGHIDWDFLLRPAVSVIESPDDYLDFERLIYRFEPMDPNTLRMVKGWVIWDSEHHAFVTEGGKKYGILTEELDNPYGGEIPITTIRKIEQNDYWGRYGADLVDGFEQAHIQLGNLWENAMFQTHGQAFGVNLGLKTGDKLLTGPKEFIHVENVHKDDVPPSLDFPKPDADIEETMGLCDWYIDKLSTNYGMPPGSWSMTEIPESGFAKFLNNAELIEKRDEMKAIFVTAEQALFKNDRMVWNRWVSTIPGAVPVPEDIELQIEFPPVSFPESPTEKQTRYMVMFKAGTSSPVDYFMHEEGLTEKEAIEKVERIRDHNKITGAGEFRLPKVPSLPEPGEGEGATE